MTAIPLRIIMHGLIALLPQNGTDGAKMTAFLVKAMYTSEGIECYANHEPEIRFPTSGNECTAAAAEGCRMETGTICLCKLDKQEISLLPDVVRNPVSISPAPARSIPFSNETAGDFAYVANLSELGYTIDPAFLSTDPATPLPPALAARFKFPFDKAAACGLATRPDDGADYVFATNLRPMGMNEDPLRDKMNQAVAQNVEATVEITVDETTGLKLQLRPFPGQPGNVRDFKLKATADGVVIRLTNAREHFSAPDHLCDDGIGRDFAFYYELVRNKPSTWAQRPVPHMKYSISKSVADLFPLQDDELCKGTKAPLSRPICPMASFRPEN